MKRFHKLNQAGDTIVEVLIVLAVLSLAFSISLATANHGLAQSRNAEEHSEALGMLVSQIEELRTATAAQISLPTNKPFCMTGASTFDSGFTSNVPASASSDNYSEYPASCHNQNVYYNESIVYVSPVAGDPTQDYYDLRIRWDGASNLGKQQVEFAYKIHQLSATASSGIPLSGSQAQVVAKVLQIPPASGNTTPSCTAAPGPGDHSGTNVTLNQTNGAGTTQNGNTDTSGTVTFTTQDYGTYTATINISTLPSGFALCNSATQGPVTTIGNTQTLNFIIRPMCYTTSTVIPGYWGPPERYSTSKVYWWWHSGPDWGPQGYGPNFSKSGYPSWESAIGINPYNDRAATSLTGPVVALNSTYGYGQLYRQGGSSYMLNPENYGFGNTTADGWVYYMNYNYPNKSTSSWYNRFEEVASTVTTDLGPTWYPPQTVTTPVCPS